MGEAMGALSAVLVYKSELEYTTVNSNRQRDGRQTRLAYSLSVIDMISY